MTAAITAALRLLQTARHAWLFSFITRLCLKRGMLAQTQRGVCGAVLSLLSPALRVLDYLWEPGLALNELSAPSGAPVSPLAINADAWHVGSGTALQLLHVLWRAGPKGAPLGGGVHRPTLPPLFFDYLAEALQLTYRIRYHALDRKVRKIVKNKYRYVRTYVCVREWHRTRLGLRLLLVGVSVQSARR